MKLRILSDYGATEQVVTEQATVEIVQDSMQAIDWQVFHQVVLENPNGDWLEVGGSLEEDGLSVSYEENGAQRFIKTPPTTVAEMTNMLLSYLSGSDDWKHGVAWE